VAVEERTVKLRTEYITLGQLIKLLDLVGSGGEVKEILARGGFQVNGEDENRRGKKLRSGDLVVLPGGQRILIE
jgi:ribosome-associated protein